MENQSSSCDELYRRLDEISRELAAAAPPADPEKLITERKAVLRQLGEILNASPNPSPPDRAPCNWNEGFCVRVENLIPAIDDEGLQTLFSPFGEIKKAMVSEFRTGHGYLTFADAKQAKHAIATMNGFHFNGWTRPIVVRRVFNDDTTEETEELVNAGDKALHRRLAAITEELKSGDTTTREKLSMERKELLSQLAKIPSIRPPKPSKDHNCTLVRAENLHPGLDDDGLRRLFSPFGKLSMARVVEDKCYGLVIFTDAQQAKNAMAAINGLHVDGWASPIAVREVLKPRANRPDDVHNRNLVVPLLQALLRRLLQPFWVWKASINLQWRRVLASL